MSELIALLENIDGSLEVILPRDSAYRKCKGVDIACVQSLNKLDDVRLPELTEELIERGFTEGDVGGPRWIKTVVIY